jgi:hypothetical protein
MTDPAKRIDLVACPWGARLQAKQSGHAIIAMNVPWKGAGQPDQRRPAHHDSYSTYRCDNTER